MEDKNYVKDIFGNRLKDGDWVAFHFKPISLTVAKVVQATPVVTSRIAGNNSGPKPAILRLIIDVTLDTMNPSNAFLDVARTSGPGADANIEKALQGTETPGGPIIIKPS